MSKKVVLIAFAWLATIVLTVIITLELVPAPHFEPASEVVQAVTPTDELDALRQELAAVRDEKEKLAQEFIALGLKQISEKHEPAIVGTDVPSRAEAREQVKELLHNFDQAHKRGGFLAGLEEAILLMTYLASLGDTGIDLMLDYCRNNTEEFQHINPCEDIYDLLAYLPSSKSMAYILDGFDQGELNWTTLYDALPGQLYMLSHEELAPHLPRLYNNISTAINGREENCDGAVSLVAHLALVTKDPQAQSMLKNTRILDMDTGSSINLANRVHDDDSRRFVEWIARYHHIEKEQEKARAFLKNW